MPAEFARRHSPRRRTAVIGVLLWIATLGFFAWPSAGQAAEPSLAGPWQGTLKAGAVELRVVFRIVAADDGTLKATMDSPDQGAKGIPIDSATREGNKLTLVARRIAGRYDGTLSDDGQRIAGTWQQAGQSFPLDLARLEKEPDLSRPQEPKKPYPYDEQELTFENAADGVTLAGTLTRPKGVPPAAAVILISGSGAQDRDETVLGHRPFLILADYLTRRGIAVLRVDDRGVGGSTGSVTQSTSADLAGDVLAGVEALKQQPGINPRRIGLIGHSEGAMIAALAAARSPDVAFVVMLAGTGVPGDQIVLHQGELIARAQKAGEARIAAAKVLQRQLFDIIQREPDDAKAVQQIRAITVESDAYRAAPDEKSKEAIESQINAQAKVMLSPWFRFFLTFDPATALREVHCPVLALTGEKDLQAAPKQNLPPIAAALEQAGNRDVTIRELPGLNHLFQHCQTGSPVEYGKIDETFAPEALGQIADWILERAK